MSAEEEIISASRSTTVKKSEVKIAKIILIVPVNKGIWSILDSDNEIEKSKKIAIYFRDTLTAKYGRLGNKDIGLILPNKIESIEIIKTDLKDDGSPFTDKDLRIKYVNPIHIKGVIGNSYVDYTYLTEELTGGQKRRTNINYTYLMLGQINSLANEYLAKWYNMKQENEVHKLENKVAPDDKTKIDDFPKEASLRSVLILDEGEYSITYIPEMEMVNYQDVTDISNELGQSEFVIRTPYDSIHSGYVFPLKETIWPILGGTLIPTIKRRRKNEKTITRDSSISKMERGMNAPINAFNNSKDPEPETTRLRKTVIKEENQKKESKVVVCTKENYKTEEVIIELERDDNITDDSMSKIYLDCKSLNLEITSEMNNHNELKLVCILGHAKLLEEIKELINNNNKGQIRIKIYFKKIKEDEKDLFFSGIVMDINLNTYGETVVKALSESILLDLIKLNIDYGNAIKIPETIENSVNSFNNAVGEKDKINLINDIKSNDIKNKTEKRFIQYFETNWDFYRRMLSYINEPIYMVGNIVKIGIPEDESYNIFNGDHKYKSNIPIYVHEIKKENKIYNIGDKLKIKRQMKIDKEVEKKGKIKKNKEKTKIEELFYVYSSKIKITKDKIKATYNIQHVNKKQNIAKIYNNELKELQGKIKSMSVNENPYLEVAIDEMEKVKEERNYRIKILEEIKQELENSIKESEKNIEYNTSKPKVFEFISETDKKLELEKERTEEEIRIQKEELEELTKRIEREKSIDPLKHAVAKIEFNEIFTNPSYTFTHTAGNEPVPELYEKYLRKLRGLNGNPNSEIEIRPYMFLAEMGMEQGYKSKEAPTESLLVIVNFSISTLNSQDNSKSKNLNDESYGIITKPFGNKDTILIDNIIKFKGTK